MGDLVPGQPDELRVQPGLVRLGDQQVVPAPLLQVRVPALGVQGVL